MLVYATVTQASPLLVTVDGAVTSSAALRLSSYTPTVGDRVAVQVFASSVLVLGKVI